MKATTVATLVAGGALGIAVGAGLMMTPQGKQMRRAIEKGVGGLGKSVSGLVK